MAVLRIAANHRSQHRDRTLGKITRANRRLEYIEENIVPGPHVIGITEALNHRGRRRGANAAGKLTDSLLLEFVLKTCQSRGLLLCNLPDLVYIVRVIRVSCMCEQSLKVDTRCIGHLHSQLHSLLRFRINPGAVIPAIHLQENIEPCPLAHRKFFHGLQGCKAVHQQVEPLDSFCQRCGPLQLARPHRHRIGNIVKAMIGKELRFCQR